MRWAFGALAAVMFGPLIFTAVMVGQFVQPFAQWRYGQRSGTSGAMPIGDLPLGLPIGPQPLVSDFQRYRLAVDAGFSPAEAIVATAISIAENGGGDPAALSGRNSNNTYDLGLWQINSAHWPEMGGHDALTDPVRNAMAARAIFLRQAWCAWSTYGPCPTHPCGPPCYRNYLARAQAATR
jgi:hypothetical protein